MLYGTTVSLEHSHLLNIFSQLFDSTEKLRYSEQRFHAAPRFFGAALLLLLCPLLRSFLPLAWAPA